MGLTRPQGKKGLEILILSQEPRTQVGLRAMINRICDLETCFSLHESFEAARRSLYRGDFDLVIFDGEFSQLIPNERSKIGRRTPMQGPAYLLIADRDTSDTESHWPRTDVDAVLPKEQLDDELLQEILADLLDEQTTDLFPYQTEETKFFNRNYLKNYLNSIINLYTNSQIKWLLVLLEINPSSEPAERVRMDSINDFYRSISDSVREDIIIDKKLGRYDKDVFWCLYACESLTDKLKESVGSSLIDLKRSADSVNDCNAVVQRFIPDNLKLNKVVKEIDRSLKRAHLTPGSSVIYHSYC